MKRNETKRNENEGEIRKVNRRKKENLRQKESVNE